MTDDLAKNDDFEPYDHRNKPTEKLTKLVDLI